MKWYWVLFIIVIVIAAIPRATELLADNYLFGYDQGQTYSAAKQIVIDHKFTLIGTPVGGQGGFFQGAGWYYLVSIPFFFMQGNPYGGMILMFLLGMGTVAGAMLLGRKMFGWQTGILIGFFIASEADIIAQSRFMWAPFPVSLLTIIFLYFIYQTLLGRKYMLAFSAFMISLMSHFETAIAGTLLFSSALFIPALVWKRLITWKSLFLAIIFFSIPLLPLFLFDIRHQFIITKGMLHYNQAGIPNNHHISLALILQNHLAIFTSTFSGMFQNITNYWPQLITVIYAGSILYIFDKKIPFARRFFVIFLALSPLTLFIVFLLYSWPIWDWWILELPIFYCFLFGILLYYFFQFRVGKLLLAIVIIYFSLIYFQYAENAYLRDYHDYGGVAKIKGKLDAIDYIYKDAQKKPFGLLVFTPPVYTYPYDYLLWWHGLKAYHYLPYNKKSDMFYLLIEKDPYKPWSYKGWLETVVKVGRVEKTITLPSGFIIQKRYL